ncbi:hypothetical protein KYG33_20855 [Chryseobacterium sp. D764]|uniref:hypothetical protein n=1 Tax=unclassified Chryseobacterium TaxID=2593645 RepID=UPI000985619E|nr:MULTISPECIES: hypothetical protein [unclassified Chryseobacterium]QXU49172.1 hypothetical protein KYG33_20855 [Chryseobacterium sp. D764]
MDYTFYLRKFQLATSGIPEEILCNNGLKLSVDIVLESVALKVYNPEWSGDPQSPLDAEGRIFFSVWLNDETIREKKIYYNIHALKLRTLKAYKISSRDFAQNFRKEFLEYQKEWPNVSVNYGPLTLMQGWVELQEDSIEKDICELAQLFLKITPVIDRILELYKR